MTITSKKQKQGSSLSVTPTSSLPLAVALSDNEEKKPIHNTSPKLRPYSEDGLRVSEAVYWEHYYEHPDFNYEWNNGVLEEKPVSNRITYQLFAWLQRLLDEFLAHYPLGETVGLETGGRIVSNDETFIRKPDFAVILKSNPIPFKDKDNSYKGTFDMVIEAISKSKKEHQERDTITKKREYALGGVKEYYILDGDKEETVFYRLNKEGIYEEIISNDGIIRSEVLSGFQFRLSDLYEMPPIEDLMNDEVYSGFVRLNHQADKQRADMEAAARRKEAAARRKEVAARREAEQRAIAAEAEIARLKALLKK